MTTHRRFLQNSNSNSNSTNKLSPPSISKSSTAEPPESVTVESDFVVILAALLCALICVVGLVAVARCAWLRRGPNNTNNNGRSGRQPSANKGLKKKTLQSLPKYIYDSGSAAENGGAKSSDCAICLAEYVDGDEIRLLPQCGHVFHVQCIDTWLGSHSSCPSCRQILVVTRCQKCGEFPAVSSVDTPPAPASTDSRFKVTASTSSTFLP